MTYYPEEEKYLHIAIDISIDVFTNFETQKSKHFSVVGLR